MILEVDDIAFNYRSKNVLNGIEFKIRKNEILSILGPNGVGKTTLLKCMNAILKPESGAIYIEEEDVLKLGRIEIAKKLGYVPQQAETGRLTAFDAILLGRRPHITWNISEKDLKIVNSAIKKMNLEDLALRYIDEMSGGEVQKVSIARALVQEPKVLLLDEPTSSLDLRNQLGILDIIKQVVDGHNVSAIMTMHDLNLALRYSDQFIFLKNGTIYSAGSRKEVTPEMIEEVYGVSVAIEKLHGHPVVIPL